MHNRIHKVDDTCVKLNTVASDIMGASSRAMILAIIAGHKNSDWLADKAGESLRSRRRVCVWF